MLNRLFIFTALALLILSSMACANEGGSSDELQTVNWWVKPVQVPCASTAPHACLQVSASEEYGENWQTIYEGIEGFNFEPNVIQRIKVSIEELDPETVPQDASSVKYELVETLSREELAPILLNDIYVLERLDTSPIQLAEGQERPRLELNPEQNRVSGTDGCNQLTGEMTLKEDNVVEFSNLGLTRMLCPNMDLPNEFMQRLEDAHFAQRDGLKLYLFDKDWSKSMTFQKVD